MPFLARFILSALPANPVPARLISYIPGKTPFSTWPAAFAMTMTYLAIVFGTREIMKDRPAMKLTTLFRTHNLLLSVASLILLLLILEERLGVWLKHQIGTYGLICAGDAYTDRLESYLMVNYYFKYYEFVDTILLVLRKKPLMFLHVYHHAITVILVFVELNERTTVSWVPVSLNLGVHVLMYYYYYATSSGVKIWWKQHLTTIQIVQFVIMLSVTFFATYQQFAHEFFPEYLPNMGSCDVTPTAGVVGIGIIASYLLLFIDFFYKKYVQKGILRDVRRGVKPAIASTNGPNFSSADSEHHMPHTRAMI